MNMGAHNAGFITYVAILTMSFLLLLAFMGLRIGQICESNAVDEFAFRRGSIMHAQTWSTLVCRLL